MQVIAKKKLYYGIIRHEGTAFELTSQDHFDARVHTPVEDAPKPKKKVEAPQSDKPTDAEAELAAAKAEADAEAQKAEAERLLAENAKAKADEGKGGNDTPQPTVRRRSTADKR